MSRHSWSRSWPPETRDLPDVGKPMRIHDPSTASRRWGKRERRPAPGGASIGWWRCNDYGGRAAARQPDSPTPEPGDLPAFPRHLPRPCAATRAIHAPAPHLLLPRGPPSYYAARRLAQGPAPQPAQSVRHDESSQSPRGPLQLVPCNIELSSCAVP